MLLPSSVIDPQGATELGYKALTTPFYLPREREMLDRTMQDLDAGKVAYALVGHATAPEIWRKDMVTLTESNAVKIPFDPRGTERPLAI